MTLIKDPGADRESPLFHCPNPGHPSRPISNTTSVSGIRISGILAASLVCRDEEDLAPEVDRPWHEGVQVVQGPVFRAHSNLSPYWGTEAGSSSSK